MSLEEIGRRAVIVHIKRSAYHQTRRPEEGDRMRSAMERAQDAYDELRLAQRELTDAIQALSQEELGLVRIDP